MKEKTGAFHSAKQNVKRLILKFLPDPLLTPLKKFHYARVLSTLGDEFADDFRVIKALVRPGDKVVDLGAHIGIYTKYLSTLVGSNGRVFSVEPFPLNFDILGANVKKMKLTNVQLINCAVSNQPGRVTMEVPRFSKLGESFYDARIASPGSDSSLRRAEVLVDTLDCLLQGTDHVSFVKCDVEGQELATLQGARHVIENCKPAWLLEISLMDTAMHQTIRDLLGIQGYEEFWFTGKEMRRWQGGDKPVDVFFMQPQHLTRIRQSGLPLS
jgi:FkbM family methyltransferase